MTQPTALHGTHAGYNRHGRARLRPDPDGWSPVPCPECLGAEADYQRPRRARARAGLRLP